MIYIFTIILILGLNYVLHPQKCNNENDTGIFYTKARFKYCLIIGLWFFLLLVLRHDFVGTDTQNYHALFDYMELNGFDLELEEADLSTEYGFYYLVNLFVVLGLPFRSLLAISALLYVGTISYLIYKFSEKPWVSYFVFLAFGFFIFNTTMRQCFALSFCIIAFLFAINKKILPYMLFAATACLFHSTALVFAPVYFLVKLNYSRSAFFIVILLGLVIAVFSEVFFQYANEITDKNYEKGETAGYGTLIFMLITIAIGFFYRKQLPLSNRYWLFMLVIAVCLFPLARFNPAIFRINLYFRVFMIVYLANIVNLRVYIAPLFMGLVLVFGAYQFIIGNKRAGIRVYPYVYYWEDYFEINPDARGLRLL